MEHDYKIKFSSNARLFEGLDAILDFLIEQDKFGSIDEANADNVIAHIRLLDEELGKYNVDVHVDYMKVLFKHYHNLPSSWREKIVQALLETKHKDICIGLAERLVNSQTNEDYKDFEGGIRVLKQDLDRAIAAAASVAKAELALAKVTETKVLAELAKAPAELARSEGEGLSEAPVTEEPTSTAGAKGTLLPWEGFLNSALEAKVITPFVVEMIRERMQNGELQSIDDLLDIIATAFDTTIPSGPTAGSIYERIEALDDLLGASGDGDVAAIKAKTDNLPSNPAAVGSEMTLEDDAITLSKFDESTAYPLTSADEGASSVVRTGAGEKTILDIFNQIGSAVDDVDSTGEETISLNKAVEIILAVVANNTTYDAVTNTFTIFGRDGSTVLWTVKPSLTVSGTRTESTKA